MGFNLREYANNNEKKQNTETPSASAGGFSLRDYANGKQQERTVSSATPETSQPRVNLEPNQFTTREAYTDTASRNYSREDILRMLADAKVAQEQEKQREAQYASTAAKIKSAITPPKAPIGVPTIGTEKIIKGAETIAADREKKSSAILGYKDENGNYIAGSGDERKINAISKSTGISAEELKNYAKANDTGAQRQAYTELVNNGGMNLDEFKNVSRKYNINDADAEGLYAYYGIDGLRKEIRDKADSPYTTQSQYEIARYVEKQLKDRGYTAYGYESGKYIMPAEYAEVILRETSAPEGGYTAENLADYPARALALCAVDVTKNPEWEKEADQIYDILYNNLFSKNDEWRTGGDIWTTVANNIRETARPTAVGIMLGLAKGLGSESIAKLISEDVNEKFDTSYARVSQLAPTATNISNTVGTIGLYTALAYLTGGVASSVAGAGASAVGASAASAGVKLATAGLTGAMTFGSVTALQNLGDYARGNINIDEYSKRIGQSEVVGAATSLASGLVRIKFDKALTGRLQKAITSNAGENFTTKIPQNAYEIMFGGDRMPLVGSVKNPQTAFYYFTRNMASGLAGSGAFIASNALVTGQAPTPEQVAYQFAFGFVSSLVHSFIEAHSVSAAQAKYARNIEEQIGRIDAEMQRFYKYVEGEASTRPVSSDGEVSAGGDLGMPNASDLIVEIEALRRYLVASVDASSPNAVNELAVVDYYLAGLQETLAKYVVDPSTGAPMGDYAAPEQTNAIPIGIEAAGNYATTEEISNVITSALDAGITEGAITPADIIRAESVSTPVIAPVGETLAPAPAQNTPAQVATDLSPAQAQTEGVLPSEEINARNAQITPPAPAVDKRAEWSNMAVDYGEQGREAFDNAFDETLEGAELAAVADDFRRFYNEGRNSSDGALSDDFILAAEETRLPARQILGENEATELEAAAFAAGVQDARNALTVAAESGIISSNDIEGGNNNGRQESGVRVRGRSLRGDVQSTGEQTQAVRGEQAQDQSGRTRDRGQERVGQGARRGFGLSFEARGQKVSGIELGLRSGTEKADVIVDTKADPYALRKAAQHGYRYIQVKGNIEVSDGGETFRVNGVKYRYNGQTIIAVNADDPRFTPKQLWLHEQTHAEIADGRADIKKLANAVFDIAGSEENVKELIRAYRDKYAGVMTTEKWIEELICDSKAAMDRFGVEGAKKAMDSIRRAAGKVYEASKADDIRYSISKTPSGKKYVALDNDIFISEDGTPLTPRQAYNALVGQKIVLEDGDTITFVKKLPGNRDMYNELFRKYPAFKGNINIKAVSDSINKNIVDTITASTMDKPNQKQKHQHLGVTDFDKRSVYVYDGNKAYDLKLSIANLTDGSKIAYAKSFIEEAGADISAEIKKAETAWKSQPESTFDNYTTTSSAKSQEEISPSQKISSAKTSIKQVPALFNNPNVEFGETNVDIGGGRFDLATQQLAENGTRNYVFDPFNRSEASNRATLDFIKESGGADTVTCANVLNVIAEPEARANVILEAAKAIKPDGTAYFMVYEGDGKGEGRETSAGWQNNRTTASYVSEIERYFGDVQRKGKLIIASDPQTNGERAYWQFDENADNGERFSRTDSTGRELSEGQQEFFKDSKARDDDGRLVRVYHGTRNANFTVFRRNYNYFTDNAEVADSYAPYSERYEGYVNITKPFVFDAQGAKWSRIPVNAGMRALLEKNGASVYKEDGEWHTSVADIVSATGDMVDNGEADYDGVIIKNVDDTGEWFKKAERNVGTDYITFSSRQFKNVDNLNPTESDDIRYSDSANGDAAQMLSDLRRQLREANAKLAAARGQLKRTEQPTVRSDDARRISRDVIKRYGSSASVDGISKAVEELGNLIVRGGDEQGDATFTRVKEAATDIMYNIISMSDDVYDADTVEVQKQIRSRLQSAKFYVSQYEKGDLSLDYESYDDFRRRNFGNVKTTSDPKAMHIDTFYDEICGQFPWMLDTGLTSQAEQLKELIRVSEMPLKPTYNIAEEAEVESLDLLDRIMSAELRQVETFADRAQKKLDQAVVHERLKQSALKEKITALKEDIEREKAKRREELKVKRAVIEEERKRFREYKQTQAEKRRAREASDRLLKMVKRVNRMDLNTPNRAWFEQHFGDIYTLAKTLTGNKIISMENLEKRYGYLKETDQDFIGSDRIENQFAEFRNKKRDIASMTEDEIAAYTTTLLMFEKQVRDGNRMTRIADRTNVRMMAYNVISDVNATKGVKPYGVVAKVENALITSTLDAVRSIRRYTGYNDGDPLYQRTLDLAQGQEETNLYVTRARAKFANLLADKKFTRWFTGPHAEEIKVTVRDALTGEETELKLTPALRTALYLNNQNDDNRRHITYGGVLIPDIKLLKKGDFANAYAQGKTVRLTPTEISKITRDMTSEEKNFARVTNSYFSEMSAPEIERVYEELFGVPPKMVGAGYYPLKVVKGWMRNGTDETFDISADTTAGAFDIGSPGWLKERVTSEAPIYLFPVDRTVNTSIEQHGKYVGLAIPYNNFNKLWNAALYKKTDRFDPLTQQTKRTYDPNIEVGTVRQNIEAKWGAKAGKTIQQFLDQISGKEKTGATGFFGRLRSNYAGAVLELNPSTALKQAPSGLAAAAVVGWQPLMKALNPALKTDTSFIDKMTAAYLIRKAGYSSQELGELADRGKKLPAALSWIIGADLATTSMLKRAAAFYVRDNTDLAVGSDEYKKAVVDIYQQIISETQPTYDVLYRSKVLRSKNPLVRAVNMFKTQPYKNFNILYDSLGNLQAKRRSYYEANRWANDTEESKRYAEEAKKAYHDAKKKVVWAFTSQAASGLMISLIMAGWDILRGRDKKYRDDEGEMSFWSFLKGLGINFASTGAGMIPGGGVILEYVEKLVDTFAKDDIFGTTPYGFSVPEVDLLNDTGSRVFEFGATLIKELTAEDGADWKNIGRKFYSTFEQFSQFAGIPLANARKTLEVMARQIFKSQGYFGDYLALRIAGTPDTNKAAYYDLLYKAYGDDKTEYDKLYKQLVSDGYSESAIKSAMEDRMKKAQGVDHVDDLSHRYLNPTQQREYDSVTSKVKRSEVWSRSDGTTKAKLEDIAYDVIAGYKRNTWQTESITTDNNLTQTEYILYKLALDVVDKPNSNGKYGTYTDAEKEKAVKMAKKG